MLFEPNTLNASRYGHKKGRQDKSRHRYYFVPKIQYELFSDYWDKFPPKDARGILDHYFTAYFNAWLNYRKDLEKCNWITGFAPRLASRNEHVRGFIDCYPDGRLIQIIRDPRTWFPSAKHHDGEASTLEPAEILKPWIESAQAILDNKLRFGQKVIVLRFEDLVGCTETVMRNLSKLLQIQYDSSLCRPTFNGRLLVANSSFKVERSGLIKAPLSRHEKLSSQERDVIERQCADLYSRVVTEALDIRL